MPISDFLRARRANALVVLVVAAGALLAMSACARATNTMTVSVAGTTNCCSDTVNSASWTTSNATQAPGSTQGSGTGKISFGAFDVNMPVDLNDIVYFGYEARGTPIASVLYTTPVIDYCMQNARVSALATNANGTDDVSFVFESMFEVNPSFKPVTGSPWSGVSWDVAKNVPATSSTAAPCGVA